MAKQPALLSLRTLRNASGSATYISPNALFTITAGINYPVEVPYRSDELPDSTTVEVNLRPNNSVGLVKERHVESLVKRTLQAMIRLEETPRMMLQVTLQVTDAEQDPSLPGGIKEGSQGETYLPVLCCAVNAAIAGCLDAAVQMDRTAGAALIGIDSAGTCLASPTAEQRKSCRSLHVFAIDDTGAVVLAESQGQFALSVWTRALELARALVQGDDQSDTGFLGLLRREVGQRIQR
jgi:exosome complex component RRP46